MARALKPGGRILIDHRDRDHDARLPGRWWGRAPDGTLALQEMKFDRRTGRWSSYAQPYRAGKGPRLLVAGTKPR